MNYLNKIWLSSVAVLCAVFLFNECASAASSSTSSSSASTSSAASADSLSSSRASLTIKAPGAAVVIDSSGVRVNADHASAPEPPEPWNPGQLGEGGSNNALVSIGHDSNLAAGARADSVVSILGSSTSAGEVSDSVVSVLGDTHITGPVGDAAVAVLGSTYINSDVRGDVVAVLGDVVLGPQAKIGGEVVAVGGTLTRDPAAEIRGGVQNVAFGAHGISFAWLRPWISHCLIYGRMLAFAPGLGWAWTLALVSLLLYVFTAMLFREGVVKCVQTLEEHPGHSLLAALLTTLATPVVMVLLAITVVGILAIPFVGIALLTAESFGKLVMLAWIGRRVTRSRSEGVSEKLIAHPAFAVLLGGLIVTLLYTIPVLGFIAYKLLGFIGLGVVIYAVLLHLRARRETQRTAASTGNGTTTSSGPTLNTAAEMQSNNPGSTQNESPQSQASASETIHPESAAANKISAATAVAYPRAGFWMRMVALLLDAILIAVVAHFVIDSHKIHLLLLAAYGAAMWKFKGATIGDIVFNLQVVRLDGRELDWATSIVRALSCFLSLFVAALGFIWIAFDEDKQSWHDKIAGTVVVRVPKGVSLL